MSTKKDNKGGNMLLNATLVATYIILILLLLLTTCDRTEKPLEKETETEEEKKEEEKEEDYPEPTVSYDSLDMVLCIDATGSMDGILSTITDHALGFYDDINKEGKKQGKRIGEFRVRVLAFRDYTDDPSTAMEDSGFFSLPDDKSAFRRFMLGIEAEGGGDNPESGLEALGLAMNSKWSTGGTNRCRVIMLWTDDEPKELQGPHSGIPGYPKSLPADFKGLTSWWEKDKMAGGTKRLVLFSPDYGLWSPIIRKWSDVTHSDDYEDPSNYENIIRTIVDSI